VQRIRTIHSFRLAVLRDDGAPRPRLLLSVGFDGGWEPYMRRIWRDLGPLLDVIFCHCDDYLLSAEHGYPEYAAWVRRQQVGTEFFYHASALTVNDLVYLRERERRRLVAPHAAGAACPMAGPLPEPPEAPKPAPADLYAQARPALAALYRLTDMFRPNTPDGDVLKRAARDVLRGLLPLLPNAPPAATMPVDLAAWDWFAKPPRQGGTARRTSQPAPTSWNPAAVQSGIIEGHPDAAHGVLVLVGLRDAAAAGALLEHVRPMIASSEDQARSTLRALGPRRHVNLSFTYAGLQLAGLPRGAQEALPQEFCEGMAARASILGDFHFNHPTRWTLPLLAGPRAKEFKTGSDRVQLSSVHAVVQVTLEGPLDTQWAEITDAAKRPLLAWLNEFDAALHARGVRVLAVQPLQRRARDHFGFVDGISQPHLGGGGARDRVLPGDLLLGYENSLRDAPAATGRLWEGSTFLVLRKLRQDVAALEDVERRAPGAKEYMMGRKTDGSPLSPAASANDFDFKADPVGRECPLHSHVRRANPRTPEGQRPDLPKIPRLLRRGMSYGPDARDKPDDERGLVFMAYNASIAEQFEVIQAWINGGNASRELSFSMARDPFLGVPLDGNEARQFEYTDAAGRLQSVALPAARPPVTLEWGLYLFVPSVFALEELADFANEQAQRDAAARAESNPQANLERPGAEALRRRRQARDTERATLAAKGAALIARLQRLEQQAGQEAARTQWKIALEDLSARMSGASRAIWTAIRQLHDGVLRTPYGVLVGSKQRVMEVFADKSGLYSATGYLDRMRGSFGEIFLGMDHGTEYDRQSKAANDAIMTIGKLDAYQLACKSAKAALHKLRDQAGVGGNLEVRDFVDLSLAEICKEWFGLPDDQEVVPGGWHWRDDSLPPTCPGHFHSPSRYMFQPNPGEDPAQVGQAHGQQLKKAALRFVERHRAAAQEPPGTITAKLFRAIAPEENDRLASTLIGVMMGFLPTVDGNLRATLWEWVSDQSLWDHQAAYQADAGEDLAKAERVLLEPLTRTMQLRPVPELVWRTARCAHTLGRVDVNAGDRIVVSIVSATQQNLLDDTYDLYPIFGGKRTRDGAHPTHACPGYEAAMGVMLGMLAALMGEDLRPTLSPMALRFEERRSSGASAAP
jgi:Dyp-type peroxidase family